MEKNPEIVARRARQLEDENWRFRSHVKMLPAARRINVRAREFGEQAAARMDCTTCAACCRDNWIEVDDAEVRRLAECLAIAPEEFRARYVVHDEGEYGIDARPCPFLQGSLCTVYAARPDACRGYPYIGGDIPSRMIGIIERAETCPIVFEMLEQLKQHVGFKRPG